MPRSKLHEHHKAMHDEMRRHGHTTYSDERIPGIGQANQPTGTLGQQPAPADLGDTGNYPESTPQGGGNM
ncbi:MAG: hypothetical protein ACLQBD_18355 [Syntrophobacteraceae bacterium]